MLKMKGLDDAISVLIVKPEHGKVDDAGTMGWIFDKDDKSVVLGVSCQDTLYDLKCMKDLYKKACPEYEGRITVPVLWDKKTE